MPAVLFGLNRTNRGDETGDHGEDRDPAPTDKGPHNQWLLKQVAKNVDGGINKQKFQCFFHGESFYLKCARILTGLRMGEKPI